MVEQISDLFFQKEFACFDVINFYHKRGDVVRIIWILTHGDCTDGINFSNRVESKFVRFYFFNFFYNI